MELAAYAVLGGPFTPDVQLGTPPDEAPDAGSSCGDSTECLRSRLDELDAAQLTTQTACMPRVPAARRAGPPSRPSTSCDSCNTDLCGGTDDFQLMGDDASALLDDARDTLMYPGGVDAALADWEAACSSPPKQQQHQHRHHQRNHNQWHHHNYYTQQPPQQSSVSFSACVMAGAAQQGAAAAFQQRTAAPAACQQHWQWQAFDGDAVGAVLAGALPAPSCSSGGGLTACFHTMLA